MKEKIDKFLELLPTITKEESDYIQEVLNWHTDDKVAFVLAKRVFEHNLKNKKTKKIKIEVENE